MKKAAIALLFLLAFGLVGHYDHRSTEVTHRAAMEAPRPIFEPAAQARRLTAPCTWVKQDMGWGNEPSGGCVDADLRTESK